MLFIIWYSCAKSEILCSIVSVHSSLLAVRLLSSWFSLQTKRSLYVSNVLSTLSRICSSYCCFHVVFCDYQNLLLFCNVGIYNFLAWTLRRKWLNPMLWSLVLEGLAVMQLQCSWDLVLAGCFLWILIRCGFVCVPEVDTSYSYETWMYLVFLFVL